MHLTGNGIDIGCRHIKRQNRDHSHQEAAHTNNPCCNLFMSSHPRKKNIIYFTQAGLRTYFRSISGAFPDYFAATQWLLPVTFNENYRSGTVRDSHPCSLLIADRHTAGEPTRPQRYNIFSAMQKTFYQQTGLNFLTKLQLTVDQHNILTDFYNMFGIVLKP